ESSVEETAPLAGASEPGGAYLNQMLALATELKPRELLAELRRIEDAAGRTRNVHWGPRTLDLDIVCFERQTVQDNDLVVPHPAVSQRDFWRRELDELRQALGQP